MFTVLAKFISSSGKNVIIIRPQQFLRSLLQKRVLDSKSMSMLVDYVNQVKNGLISILMYLLIQGL